MKNWTVVVSDAEKAAKAAHTALDTAVAILDADNSPTRSENHGYTANRALGHLRTARELTRMGLELLRLLAEQEKAT